MFFLHYLNSAGGLRQLVEVEGAAQQDRFVGGAQQLSEGLARGLGERLRLSSPVREVAQDDQGVTVTSAGGELRARFAVLAMPPHLTGRVRFTPALPAMRDQLLQRWSMGATVKVMAFYDAPRWRAKGLSGEAVLASGPLSVVYDNCSHDGEVACLLGFVVGKHARAWSARPADERRAAALGQFERLFGVPAKSAVDYLEQDWASEPWTGGCPVASMGPGVLTGFGEVLRRPFGRVHFAGTETARHWTGYLEGALESAERVGCEVLTRLARE